MSKSQYDKKDCGCSTSVANGEKRKGDMIIVYCKKCKTELYQYPDSGANNQYYFLNFQTEKIMSSGNDSFHETDRYDEEDRAL